MSHKNEQGIATNSCPTGKISYPTRASAHDAAVRARKRGEHVRPFRCVRDCGGWHVGHIPAATVRGQMTAADYYAQFGSAS